MKIVIYGPQGCGKTRNAEAIKQYFGADEVIVDDLSHNASVEANKTTVVFTNDESKHHDYTYDQIKQLVPNLI